MTTRDSGLAESLQRLDQMPPLRQRVHEQLESLISTGAFPPGARLVEGDLAERLGVSRGPIREALQMLWRDGFVDLRPRQGAFVHVPTSKEVEDFFDIRRALEKEAARLAARRVTKEWAATLQQAIDTAHELLDEGSDPSDASGRVPIHQLIAQCADNKLLAQMLETVYKHSAWYLSPFEPQLRRKAWAEHDAIVRAIVDGDTAAAMDAVSRHIESAHKHYIEYHELHGHEDGTPVSTPANATAW